jgi:hypothetical protein
MSSPRPFAGSAARRPSSRLLSLLLLIISVFVGCDNPIQPPDRPADAAPPPAIVDQNTLLLLHFDGQLTGEAGEEPLQAINHSFTEGILGSGVTVVGPETFLEYASAGNFRADAGTIEFWVKPLWNGDDGRAHHFVSLGDQLVLAKDGADNLRFFFREDDSEAYQAYNLTSWRMNEWHHIAVTWTIPGTMRTYVDAVEVIAHPSSAQDLVAPVPETLTIGSWFGDGWVNAVMDELRISDIARTQEEIAASYAAASELIGLAIQPITTEPYKTWRQAARLIATTTTGTRVYPAAAAEWSSSSPEVATVDVAGVIRALKAGRTTITARVGDVAAATQLRVRTPLYPPRVEAIAPYLATPAAGHQFKMPVVILRFLPTADGVTLDPAVSPDFYTSADVTLDELKGRLDRFDVQVKFMLEEGSRFRGYRDPAAPPALGYRVVRLVTIYEPTPPGKVLGEAGGFPVYLPDYRQILERFNARHYVEDLGVKEFWIWQSHFDAGMPSYDPAIHKPEVFRGLWESNMASRISGDISNSDRDPDDLPIYDQTYMVYGQNLWRSEREAVHNHGHQLESILLHANGLQDGNTELFLRKFMGELGRVGSTHKPPNTTVDYDYHENYDPVASDIADWTPGASGRREVVTADTWGRHPYAWPLGTAPTGTFERNESHWYIYWMQSMPGWGSTVPYGRNVMTNWWRYTGDWDGSMKARLGLYGSCARAITAEAAAVSARVLSGQVGALQADGLLAPARAEPLRVKLVAAADLLDAERPAAGVTALRGFLSRLETLIQEGRISVRDSRTLKAGGQCLIQRLEA